MGTQLTLKLAWFTDFDWSFTEIFSPEFVSLHNYSDLQHMKLLMATTEEFESLIWLHGFMFIKNNDLPLLATKTIKNVYKSKRSVVSIYKTGKLEV